MNFTKFIVSGLTGLILTFSSCIDADYDLGKDIDLEVSIGGNLSLPIGQTDTIRLSRMIEEGDVLHVIDGKYVITKSDNIAEDIEAIDEVIIDDFSPNFDPYIRDFKASTTELPQIPGLDMPDIEVAFEANIDTEENFNVNTELPAEVKNVKSIKITDNNGQTLQTELSIEISGMPSFLHDIYLAGVKLNLPEVIDFGIDESQGDLVKSGSSIFISKTIELNQGSGVVSIPVTVYGFSDPTVKNGTLILTDAISLEGKVYADKVAIGTEDLTDTQVKVQPRLDLATPQIRIKEVAGTIVPNVDINTSVSLSDLPDFLKEEGTSLEVKDLSLNLSVQNPIGAPISTRFQITPLDENGQVVNGNVVSLALKIAGGQKSTFHINRNSPEIESGSLTSLLNTIPDQIDIKVTEVKIESETDDQTISLGKGDYNLDVDYDINVPLEFDNLSIFYNDTIDNIHSDLSDISDKVKHIELNMQVDNAIPLELSLSIKPYDRNGNPLTGLTLPDQIMIEAAPNSDGNEQSIQSTQVNLTIKEDRANALQELDKLAIQIGGSNQDNHDVTLRPDQFVVVHLSARLPDGAQMDLEDL
ncbi:MAG TPA: hypothetical protein H9834_09705 [Candidatus Barnesiella excrementavium]|nr:hypothetical protein [Candidatus Barnesiella excrementavium]